MVDICQISVRFFPSTCTRRIGKNCENNIKIKASSATLSQDRALFIYNLDKNKFTETSSTNPRNPNPQTGILTIQTVRFLGVHFIAHGCKSNELPNIPTICPKNQRTSQYSNELTHRTNEPAQYSNELTHKSNELREQSNEPKSRKNRINTKKAGPGRLRDRP